VISTQKPPAAPFDFCSQTFKRDPLPTLVRMRELGPVIRTRFPFFGGVWMTTTYDAVNELLRDHHRFVQNPAAAGNRWMVSVLRWLPRTLQPIARNMLLVDGPDHRRLRGLVDRAFQVRSVEALRPRLEALCDEALNHLEEQAAATPGGQVDLVAHFARPFPLAVICELLGLPGEDRPQFTQWAGAFSRSGSLLGIALGLRGLSKLMGYLRQEIKRQQAKPGEGLLTALIEAEEAGDRLSEDELLAMAFLLLAAGHETTLHQIAGSVLTLLDHPEQLAELRSNWSLGESAVHELFRYVSFAQIAKPRYARQDTEFYGQPIRRGEPVFGCLAAANFDPSQFDDPARFDIHRPAQRHLALGAGIHFCLGASLARVETEIAFRRLFARFPQIRLATARSQIHYSRRPGTRGLLSLPVGW
jgi:cytochrome P450